MIGALANISVDLTNKSSAAKPTSSSPWTFVFIIGVFALVYFFFLRPRSVAAKKQRAQNSQVEVGDEILTVGGIVGRVIEESGDRLTIVTGHKTADGQDLDPPHHRMVIVRQAVARKINPVVPDLSDDDEVDGELDDDEGAEDHGQDDDETEVGDESDGDGPGAGDEADDDDEDEDEDPEHHGAADHGDDGAPTGGGSKP